MTTRRQRLQRLENRADRFERLVATALRRAIKAGTSGLGNVIVAAIEPAEPYVSIDDLAAIETAWQTELRELILPELGRTVADGAQDAIEDLVLKVPVLIDARHPAAELFVSQADNRLQGIGADLWQKTRTQLVEGMAAGESIPELSKRVRGEIASSTVRARTIARTEVVSASNAGALAQMQALGEDGPAAKVWLSTNDARTRLSHREANGQQVPLVDKFEVGGAALGFPGDPSGPADEVINCRCTLTWEMESAARLVAAGFDTEVETLQEEHTSGMVALIPSQPVVIEGGEPPEESHLTLFFLGEAAEIPSEVKEAILTDAKLVASATVPLTVNAFGAAVWNPHGEDPCVVLNVGGVGLSGIRNELASALFDTPSEWQMPEQHTPWSPHVCLAYDAEPANLIPGALELVGPIEFDKVRVALGNEVHDFALGGN